MVAVPAVSETSYTAVGVPELVETLDASPKATTGSPTMPTRTSCELTCVSTTIRPEGATATWPKTAPG